ncbi:MAG: hypothetical protein H6679_02690 [Epsilonproteobacteria bacterium]|nr:hypothetical protein [Campylobacterota bacterium]
MKLKGYVAITLIVLLKLTVGMQASQSPTSGLNNKPSKQNKLLELYKLAQDDDIVREEYNTKKTSHLYQQFSKEQYIALVDRLKKHIPMTNNYDGQKNIQPLQKLPPYTKKLLIQLNQKHLLPYTHALYAFLAWSIYFFIFTHSPYKIAFYDNLYLPYIRWKPYRPRLEQSSIPLPQLHEPVEYSPEDSEERKKRITQLQAELDRILEDIYTLSNASLDKHIKDETLLTLNQQKEEIMTKLRLLQKHISPLFYYDRKKASISLALPIFLAGITTLLVAGSYNKTKKEFDLSTDDFFKNMHDNFEFLWT